LKDLRTDRANLNGDLAALGAANYCIEQSPASATSLQMTTRRSAIVTALQLSLRAAVAAGSAVAIAQLLNLQYPIYALLAAVIVMDLSPSKTLQLATQRLAGTLVGATVGAVLSYSLPPGPSAIVVSILIAMCLSYVLQLRGAAKLAGYVCGIVILSHTAHAWSYALYRVIETFLGIAMAVLVSLVPKLLRMEIPDERDS
jgi:uncharacterized membrane protein YgaE (UPF0421/DUF939 family)